MTTCPDCGGAGGEPDVNLDCEVYLRGCETCNGTGIMGRALADLVDGWLGSLDGPERDPRPGYNRAFKLPRPKLNQFGIGFLIVADGTSGRFFTLTAICDDAEAVIGPNGKPYTAKVAAESIDRYIKLLLLAIDSDAHAIIDGHEAAYHTSDEAMRATHPREA